MVRCSSRGGEGSTGSLVSAELYDPGTGTWSTTGSLADQRKLLTATLLPNGMVLVAGGYDTSFGGGSLASAELYDPATGTWSTTGSLKTARSGHTATLLPNGKVLVAGGTQTGSSLVSAELYDPATGTWSTTGILNTARTEHTATLLPNGKVLVAGGLNGVSLASAELYDPAIGTWTTTGSLNGARYLDTATLLPNGKVLVAGGIGSTGALASAELYDPATGIWSLTGTLNEARLEHTATLLPNGQVLVAAGLIVSAELYDPATGTWSATGSLNQARARHTATLLPNGQVLAAGGTTGVNWLATAELYGSPVELATHVAGRGAFDNQGNEVTFKFSVTQGDDRFLGDFAFCDPAADICIRAKVSSLTITGNSADFSGTIHTKGRITGTFDVSVTDNGSPGTLDTISINLSNGYSAGGMLTSGGIRIY